MQPSPIHSALAPDSFWPLTVQKSLPTTCHMATSQKFACLRPKRLAFRHIWLYNKLKRSLLFTSRLLVQSQSFFFLFACVYRLQENTPNRKIWNANWIFCLTLFLRFTVTESCSWDLAGSRQFAQPTSSKSAENNEILKLYRIVWSSWKKFGFPSGFAHFHSCVASFLRDALLSKHSMSVGEK